ncbi:hypothetical protein A2392_01605 [Candidatus Kaiserbacteria bacterium RIFOXYB1_FULL_46_14]|uniref:ATP-cone domain-containing protein n=1 Tax=Candidatus Kaiserbacteria bacterium RIFOXYB1_FULL_46_14 TaxID=1798531 RepID=A0A1F6FJV0_9BACT|nr:MAG: hypothetical protein A2392_01605 [Candidatus Kaiserbacteria bacterium RIFOXYB1_FULL_46_14]
MLVTKADGTVEEFDSNKLRRSLKKSGAAHDAIEAIVSDVEKSAHDGMRTQEIYRHAFSILRGTKTEVVARYALRRALFNLGPTGFPFETFLGRLFETQGYKTSVGITLKGKCALHEIDLAAYRADHSFIAEAKFHARPGIKSDLQVAMYSYARLLDLSDRKICSADVCGIKNLKIITNTKFTAAAIKYANCVGVDLMAWDYPKEDNLYSLIDKTGLFPITVLTSLSAAQKMQFLNAGLIVTSDVLHKTDTLSELGLSQGKLEALISEARQLSKAD